LLPKMIFRVTMENLTDGICVNEYFISKVFCFRDVLEQNVFVNIEC